MNHADLNELLPARQSAYRRFHSTESAVLIVYNDIVRAIDDGHVVALVVFDLILSSAFDSVDHPFHPAFHPPDQVFFHRAVTGLVSLIRRCLPPTLVLLGLVVIERLVWLFVLLSQME